MTFSLLGDGRRKKFACDLLEFIFRTFAWKEGEKICINKTLPSCSRYENKILLDFQVLIQSLGSFVARIIL